MSSSSLSRRRGDLLVDLEVLSDRAQHLGQAFPRLKFSTAPEIHRLWLQARILGVDKHPFSQWLLREEFYLLTNRFLHGVEDILRAVYMADIVYSAELAEEQLGGGGDAEAEDK